MGDVFLLLRCCQTGSADPGLLSVARPLPGNAFHLPLTRRRVGFSGKMQQVPAAVWQKLAPVFALTQRSGWNRQDCRPTLSLRFHLTPSPRALGRKAEGQAVALGKGLHS